MIMQDLDLSRFDAAPLIAFTAAMETGYGIRERTILVLALLGYHSASKVTDGLFCCLVPTFRNHEGQS